MRVFQYTCQYTRRFSMAEACNWKGFGCHYTLTARYLALKELLVEASQLAAEYAPPLALRVSNGIGRFNPGPATLDFGN